MKTKATILLIVFILFSVVINDVKADKTSLENKQKESIIGETETTGVLGANNNFTLEEKDLLNDIIDKEFTDNVINKYDSQLLNQPEKSRDQ